MSKYQGFVDELICGQFMTSLSGYQGTHLACMVQTPTIYITQIPTAILVNQGLDRDGDVTKSLSQTHSGFISNNMIS
jgi:hypothetical protein